MVNDESFKEFLAKSCIDIQIDDHLKETVNNAAIYASMMMDSAIKFLNETHSMSEEIYIANLAALVLATSPDLDTAIHCGNLVTAKLIDIDGRFNKSG